jgi:hypothetical protein
MRSLHLADYPTPMQMQLLDYMENGPTRRTICAFRGIGKSTLASFYLLWRLYKNPEEKCLIVSASMSRAEAMSAWMLKTIAEVPWLNHLLPDSHDGRYSRIAFDVGTCKYIEQSPSVRAAGITGQITGSRASIILADDVETVTTALTQVQREKLKGAINEFEAIKKPGPDSEVMFLGTPHSSTDSIYFTLNRDLNYDMRMFPARVPQDLTPYNGCLAKVIEEQVGTKHGQPTDTRFNDDELLQRELSMSPLQWQLQFQLNPTLQDQERYPLRCGDLMVTTLDGHLPEVALYDKAGGYKIDDLPCVGMSHDPTYYRPREMEGSISSGEVPTVMALDPSGGGSDEFAYAVVKAHGGNFFLVESGGKLGGVNEEFWQRLAVVAKKHRVNEILVETNFGGLAVYEALLKPYLIKVDAACRIEPIRSNQRKELRIIDTLAPVMQTHRMVVDRRVIEEDHKIVRAAKDEKGVAYSLMFQLSRITYDRGCLLHDDRLDAFAMCVQHFQEQAAQDQKIRFNDRMKEVIAATVADDDGWMLLNATRQAMGMSIEQARRAEVMDGGKGGSWI